MDSKENGIKQAKKVVARIKSHEHVSWEEMKHALRVMNQQSVERFDEIINSRWTWGNKKTYMKIFRALIEITWKTSEDTMEIYEQLDGLTKAIRILSREIESSKSSTSELEETLNKIEKKLASPKFERAVEYLDLMDKQLAKGNKVRGKYTV